MTSLLLLLLLVGALAVKHLFFWQPIDVGHLYQNGPLMMGHRGAPREAPENTIPSFQRAVELGLDAVEVDVICTLDGDVVCSHNHDLERETDGFGYIHESDYSTLAGINAGVKFPGLGVTPLPRLTDLITALPNHCIFDIEIKSDKPLDWAAAPEVVTLIRQHDLHGRVMVSSFNPLVLARVKMMDSTIPTAYLWSDENVPPILTKPRFINLVHADILHPATHLVDENVMKFALRKKMCVNVWTPNNAPAIRWLLSLGVDGIISDFPELIREAGEAHGV